LTFPNKDTNTQFLCIAYIRANVTIDWLHLGATLEVFSVSWDSWNQTEVFPSIFLFWSWASCPLDVWECEHCILWTSTWEITTIS
jgi:hypothetical protein